MANVKRENGTNRNIFRNCKISGIFHPLPISKLSRICRPVTSQIQKNRILNRAPVLQKCWPHQLYFLYQGFGMEYRHNILFKLPVFLFPERLLSRTIAKNTTLILIVFSLLSSPLFTSLVSSFEQFKQKLQLAFTYLENQFTFKGPISVQFRERVSNSGKKRTISVNFSPFSVSKAEI